MSADALPSFGIIKCWRSDDQFQLSYMYRQMLTCASTMVINCGSGSTAIGHSRVTKHKHDITEFYNHNGPLTRFVKIRVVHATRMPGTISPPLTSKETTSWWSRHASRHVRHARTVMHVGIANPRWRWKRFRHTRRMHIPQFYVSGPKAQMVLQRSVQVVQTLCCFVCKYSWWR